MAEGYSKVHGYGFAFFIRLCRHRTDLCVYLRYRSFCYNLSFLCLRTTNVII